MKILLAHEAHSEIDHYARWYEARRTGLGADFVHEVDRALVKIAKSPDTWPYYPLPRARRHGVRHFSLERFPFAITYLPLEASIFIAAVAHMSRKPGYWLKRIR